MSEQSSEARKWEVGEHVQSSAKGVLIRGQITRVTPEKRMIGGKMYEGQFVFVRTADGQEHIRHCYEITEATELEDKHDSGSFKTEFWRPGENALCIGQRPPEEVHVAYGYNIVCNLEFIGSTDSVLAELRALRDDLNETIEFIENNRADHPSDVVEEERDEW